MIVYDITDRESFENVKTWMVEIDKYESTQHIIKGTPQTKSTGCSLATSVISMTTEKLVTKKVSSYVYRSKNIYTARQY